MSLYGDFIERIPYLKNPDPYSKPTKYFKRDPYTGEIIEVEGRRPSVTFLVDKLREAVDRWRDNGYPGITETTRRLLTFWFFEDHYVGNHPFKFWFAQREAIETLIYLFEVERYTDLEPILKLYGRKSEIFEPEVVETMDGKRKLKWYLNRNIEQPLPPKNLLRYAFKMATGSGKTFVMALIIVWSYMNRLLEKEMRYSNNFLIIAPNVIVYERLKKDFYSNLIFHKYPFIPDEWKHLWDLKVTTRDDSEPLNPSGNLVITNIQQIYDDSDTQEQTSRNIIEAIIGPKPQTNLLKPRETLLEKILSLNDLIVINDEAHHVHSEELAWGRTLLRIHDELPHGLTLWLDFSATPKDQNGNYYPWIIVDYPLAQAIEDAIVKIPVIDHMIDEEDPRSTSDASKYKSWINIALNRWKEHYDSYSQLNRKPVLFIMAENTRFANKIGEMIEEIGHRYNISQDEIVVIHTNPEGEITKSDLERMRELVRKIDQPDNKIKVIVSVLMLREGWDVQNVTIILGLRPFTARAQILPEQALGRGLRLMSNLGPAQILEVMGTNKFEEFVRELETDGVLLTTLNKRTPPLPIVIEPERGRLKYDISIPMTNYRYRTNLKNLENLDINDIEPLNIDDFEGRIRLILEEIITGVKEEIEITPTGFPLEYEISSLVNSIIKKARLTSAFNILYPKVEKYIKNHALNKYLSNEDLEKLLSDLRFRESIIDKFVKAIKDLTVEQRTLSINEEIKLSETEKFIWRRKNTICTKTVFNYVAVYNDFEKRFAEFLDECTDIEKFASLAGTKFKIDYLDSFGAIRFYIPDFVAIQSLEGRTIGWIIETKGYERGEVKRKDNAMRRWCGDVTKLTGQEWNYVKIPQRIFDRFLKLSVGEKRFQSLLDYMDGK